MQNDILCTYKVIMVSTFRTHNFTTRYPIIIRLYCHSTHVSKLVPFHTWVHSLPKAAWVPTNAASCSYSTFLDVIVLFLIVKPGHVAFWSRRYFRCNLLPHYVWGLYLCYCVQYNGKLSREKLLWIGQKIQFSQRKLLQIARFCHA